MSPVPITELDAPQAMRRVADLRAASQTSVEEAQRIAASFPLTHVDREVGAGLASLALQLAEFAPTLPQDVDEVLAPRWSAAACAAEPSVVEGWADARLMCALQYLKPTDVAEPAPIIARLARLESSDALAALRWAEDVVVRGVLSASAVLSLLEPLSQHTDADVRARFVDALGEPWLVLTDRVRFYRRALADPDTDVARRALPHVQIEAQRVRELVPALGADAHLALVRLGDARDLDAALSVREAVLAHHRAGNFPKPEQLSALQKGFVHDQAWTAEEFARVTFTCRTELLDALSAIHADDARWSRLALLLAHAEGHNSQGQSADQILSDKLQACTDLNVAEHLIRAAADHPEFSDEDALLKHLEALPLSCFATLRRHGTERSLPQVLEQLRNPVAFGVARRDALDWCWMIASDRLGLIAEYGPESWTDEQLAQAAAPHPAAAERAREMVTLAGRDPRYAMSVLVGVFQDPNELSEPFRRAVRSELVVSGPRRPRDPAVPTVAEQALLSAERRLITQKRRVTNYRDIGPGRLIRKLTIEWLTDANERGDSRDLVLALGILARHPIGASQLRYVHPLWRAKDPNVQRAAAEALLASRHSSGLALSLSNLATTDDIRTQRQGLRAIEHFGSRWAEPEAIRSLDSRNMNVKKAAASALRVVGSARCLPAVMRWLGAYDNPGLRKELLVALDHVAGKAANSLLLDAYEDADRAQRLNLLEALQGRLSAAQLAAFAGRDATLVDACRAGTLRLAAGSWTDVAAVLRQSRVETTVPESAIDQLERLGFSDQRARAAVEEASPRLVAAIRSRLVEWAQFAVESESPEAARWVLRASTDCAPEHALVLASRAQTVDDVPRAIAALHRAAAHGEEWRVRAIEQLRSLTMPAHQRWLALRKLGAVLTRAELEDALATAAAHGAYRELLADVLPRTWRQVLMLSAPERHERVLAGWRWESESAERKEHRSVAVRFRTTVRLADVLAGNVPMPRDATTLATLARELVEWPDDEAEQRRAHPLVGSLPLHRLRAFASRWLVDALGGSQLALTLLRSVPREELLAHPEFRSEAPGIASQSPAKDWRLARLMWMHRIGPIDTVKVTEVVDAEPIDPLDAVEGADALLAYAQKARGREASRAVGRLGKLGATDHLLRALEHKDSNPRTVAMRWLRKLLERDSYMQLALRVLATERDSHLRRSLVRSVARKSFPAAFPKLVELVLDNDTRVAREALHAVQRLGDVLQPTIEHALAHERPDRARRLRELVE